MDPETIVAIGGLLRITIATATPIALAAYGGIFSERAGVVNIALEGMMLIAALTSQLAAHYIGGPWIGTSLQPYALPVAVLIGVLTGMLVAAFHAFISIRFKVNQIISGTVINIAAIGITGALYTLFLRGGLAGGVPTSPGTFPVIPIPFLTDIPIIGRMLFTHQPIVYGMLILTLLSHYILFFTPWGLRTRAVGEHPRAADTLGINVFQIRYINVIIGGALAGLAGAWLTVEWIDTFSLEMTAGRGFIALAAMIFGRYTPLGAFGAAILFSLAQALQLRFQGALGSDFVQQFNQLLSMTPYLLTMLVLAGFGGRARPPAADGIPYEK